MNELLSNYLSPKRMSAVELRVIPQVPGIIIITPNGYARVEREGDYIKDLGPINLFPSGTECVEWDEELFYGILTREEYVKIEEEYVRTKKEQKLRDDRFTYERLKAIFEPEKDSYRQ